MSQDVLVINSGSSSIKYQLVDVATGEAIASGIVERIGQASGTVTHSGPDGKTVLEQPIPDHEAGMEVVLRLFAEHGPVLDASVLSAVGHRVVQGGDVFSGPALVDDEVEAQIEALSDLAPLHNPPNLAGIRAARHAFPDAPHVAVFDTSFHQSLPPAAYTYAIDQEVARTYAIRRYGFHGTSHLFVSRATAQALGRPVEELNLIVLHLGNGASATAVRGGLSVETSMGLTPLEGLVMGTRSGDVDPSLGGYLARVAGLDAEEYDRALNRDSGLLGLCGASDFRTVLDRVDEGDADARLALDATVHRIVKYVGAYAAVLGRVDALVFTGGIGERGAPLRSAVLGRLGLLGVRVDDEANADGDPERRISAPDSTVEVWVVPTDEEREIARETLRVLGVEHEW